ncbi:Uncharacterised protein [Mycoplasmopsis maculosa]|uniref:Protein G-related albumin-binding (GA) module domain-containing protein n=1 Tax=Mycoplasmopsis maculosa TaxID=114885 RepID=A0A449B3T4_9BACT|nr:hypothetical protein [Mycoplasmopsis maculosa]VEU75263.1 Uncharacterised protein [Mycoplasmopsis maculosa]
MKKSHKILTISLGAAAAIGTVALTTVLAVKCSNENKIKNEREKLDEIINTLPYPSIDAIAKNEIKELYKEVYKIDELEKIKEEIIGNEKSVLQKIIKANNEISKLSEERRNILNNILNKTNTSEEFEELFKEIDKSKKEYLVEYKVLIENKINELKYSTSEEKNDLITKVKNANSIEEIDTLKNDLFKKEKDIDSFKEELNKIVDSLPYPSNEAIAKNEIKESFKDLKTLEELENIKNEIIRENEGIKAKIIFLNQKISELPESKRESINNSLNEANTDVEFKNILKLIQEAQEQYEEEIKNEARSFINNLSSLSGDKRNKYIEELENAASPEEVNSIKQRAEKENAFESKKTELKEFINLIEYPMPDTDEKVINSKNKLKSQIDNLTFENIEDKEKELKAFNEKLIYKKEILKRVPYTTENAEGRRDMAIFIGGVTDIAGLERILPDKWVEDVATYRRLIEENFENTQKANLIKRLDTTTASSIYYDYRVEDVEYNIYETFRNNAKDWINNNIAEDKKPEYLNRITSLRRTNQFENSFNELKTKFEEIKNSLNQ